MADSTRESKRADSQMPGLGAVAALAVRRAKKCGVAPQGGESASGPQPADSRPAAAWFVEDSDPYERHLYEAARWLVRKRTQFQDVSIIHNRGYGKILFLDGALQSAQDDEYQYHEALIHPAMLLHRRPERVLILGGGEGASLREILKHRSVKHVTMVDIDGELVNLCRAYLPEWSAGAFDDPRTTLVIADGKKWVEENEAAFDIIFMDLTDQIDLGPSFQLYTQGFYNTLRSRLNPGGLLVVQASELSICEYFSHSSISKTLASVFAHTQTYAQHIPSFFAQWSFIVAADAVIPRHVNATSWDRRIARRLAKPLRLYDGESHNRMFALPKDLVAWIRKSGVVVKDPESFSVAYDEIRETYPVAKVRTKSLLTGKA